MLQTHVLPKAFCDCKWGEGTITYGHNAWGIQQDHLELWVIDQAQDPVPGGLRFGSHDGELLPDKCIHQGAFAGIWAAQYCDVSCSPAHQ